MSFQRFVLIEPLNGGDQLVESSMNFLMWKKVLGPDKKPIPDQRESYGGNIWRIVDQADEAKDLTPQQVGPLIPQSLPIPVLPPEVMREVEPAPVPTLPDLDPAGDPVRPSAEVVEPLASPVESKKPGRPKKVTA